MRGGRLPGKWPASCDDARAVPAALPKAGTSYDLAIACAVLASAEAIPAHRLEGTVLFRLALDGRIRPVRGLLPALLAARRKRAHGCGPGGLPGGGQTRFRHRRLGAEHSARCWLAAGLGEQARGAPVSNPAAEAPDGRRHPGSPNRWA